MFDYYNRRIAWQAQKKPDHVHSLYNFGGKWKQQKSGSSISLAAYICFLTRVRITEIKSIVYVSSSFFSNSYNKVESFRHCHQHNLVPHHTANELECT